ncbi:microsomal glutathione S-transferase 2 [Astyanax mexicanus]|uniref:Microsomal glutathione S-transferase 2 n=1 Tax=Astyanax mexicanus TaxID=7994 RepID=A0A8B9HL21_ASTMX|nr:microsomal glutathione S-transferase 2 [Astyanax mexicanus]KAG9272259.1 microsomal glutathione S-transferase 2 [Astyanax mexicanus]
MSSTDQPVLLAAVSVMSAFLLGFQARRVGWSRMKHKIMPPAVNGPPEFERTFRAHQNGVEFFPMFLVVLWASGLFCNEALAALAGLVYIVGREIYFTGYSNSSRGRLPGFYLIIVVMLTLTVTAAGGIILSLLDKYLNIKLFSRSK